MIILIHKLIDLFRKRKILKIYTERCQYGYFPFNGGKVAYKDIVYYVNIKERLVVRVEDCE